MASELPAALHGKLLERFNISLKRLSSVIDMNAPDIVNIGCCRSVFNSMMLLYGKELLEKYQLQVRTRNIDGVALYSLALESLPEISNPVDTTDEAESEQ